MYSGRYKFLSILFLILCVTLLPFKTSASSPDSILVDIAPENPAPNENTTITLNSYADNLDSVFISWFVNGKSAFSGIGKKVFSVTAGAAGVETTITVDIALQDGNIEKKIVIRPSVMVLLWQAENSYVPPFYKGKALPSAGSEVRVVAMPEIKNGSRSVDGSSLLYTWQQNYNNQQDASGYGKNYFDYTNDYLDDGDNVGVNVSTLDQKYTSDANVTVNTSQPKIVFYKRDITLGTLWQLALTDGHKINDSEILEAAPYFISPKEIQNPILSWSWTLNDNFIATVGSANNLMPLKVQAGLSGTSKIGLEIKNSYKLFEDVNKEMNVEF